MREIPKRIGFAIANFFCSLAEARIKEADFKQFSGMRASYQTH